MKKIAAFFGGCALCALGGCDLQPKIMSLPDSVGDFISVRYPALLADPDAQPEIYNSAATDYGVYASPELYGSVESDDYIMYASVDDYIVPPQPQATTSNSVAVQDADTVTFSQTYYADADSGAPIVNAPAADADAPVLVAGEEYLRVPMYGGTPGTVRGATEITVQRGDTLYSLAKKYNASVDELARVNKLEKPYGLVVGQRLLVPGKAPGITASAPVQQTPAVSKASGGTPTETRVELQEITVGVGDTLYSLSRTYAIPVNDLAVMNNLTVPFALYAGQRLKVPNLKSAPVRAATTVPVVATTKDTVKTATNISNAPTVKTGAGVASVAQKKPASVETKPAAKATQEKQPAQKKKISSDPSKKLPTISARSSSKFSWPVRGTILSHYGAKSNGLFNDGINISAARGTTVKAAENGVVAYAGNEVRGMGNLVIIQHSGGWMTVYAHLDSMIVRRGAKVKVGEKIGTVGATGKVDKPQLHFEIRKGTKAYNPSSYLKK